MTIAKNKWPVRHAQNGVAQVSGVFTGGGSASDMTKTTGGRGVSSVKYNGATGKYIATFDEVGANFLGAHITILSATGQGYVAHPVAYSATNNTITFEVYQGASAHDLSTSEQAFIKAEWADSSAP